VSFCCQGARRSGETTENALLAAAEFISRAPAGVVSAPVNPLVRNPLHAIIAKQRIQRESGSAAIGVNAQFKASTGNW
jgi:hypothetical protein